MSNCCNQLRELSVKSVLAMAEGCAKTYDDSILSLACGMVTKIDPNFNPEKPEDSLDWLPEEELLTILLAAMVADAGVRVYNTLEAFISSGQPITRGRLADILDNASIHMGNIVNKDSHAKNTALFRRVINLGEARVTVGLLDDLYAVERVISGMSDSAKYYTNSYFSRFVLPALNRSIEAFMVGTTTTPDLDFRSILNVLDDRLKNVPYWRLVANAATSRAYHYGYTKAAQMAGYTRYAIRAIDDDRTSVLCLELNGQEFPLADAIIQVERIASLENPEEVSTVAPWLTLDQVKGKNTLELQDLGIGVPPYHANCRTTIEYLF